MFTGIVEEIGTLNRIELGESSARLEVAANVVTDSGLGDSIAVSGVCLTVVACTPAGFTVDVMPETLARTALAGAEPGTSVNLERAMAADGRFGGHIVQGHVDGVGQVQTVEPGEDWTVVTLTVPTHLGRYVVNQGSITIDGVSLTVVRVIDTPDAVTVTISLIPATLAATTLGRLAPGVRVNVEVDVLAKYIERLAKP